MVYSVNTRDGSIKSKNEIHNVECSVPRSGKWTVEEEALANNLIAQFEEGSLLDCLEGTTLRSYLAKRLNCAPMRISKKFAGKCIGKHMFARKRQYNFNMDQNKNIPCVSPSNQLYLQTMDNVDFDRNNGLNSISMDSAENLSQIQYPVLDSNSSLLSFFNISNTTTGTTNTTNPLSEHITKKRTYNTAFLCSPTNATTSAIPTNTTGNDLDNDNIGLDLDEFFPDETSHLQKVESEALKFTFSSLLLRPDTVLEPECQNRSLTPIPELPSGAVTTYTGTMTTTSGGGEYEGSMGYVKELSVPAPSQEEEIEVLKKRREGEEAMVDTIITIPSYTTTATNTPINIPTDTTMPMISMNDHNMPMIQNEEWTEIYTLLA